VYREWPGARLLDDGTGHVYLDVEGTSAVVRVVQAGARPKPLAGAFSREELRAGPAWMTGDHYFHTLNIGTISPVSMSIAGNTQATSLFL
jgi:hypothetical protein